METRTCRKCGQTKSASLFKRDKTCIDGLRHQCLECNRKLQLAVYQANKTKPSAVEKRKATTRKHDLKRKYGITPEQHKKMIDAQNGLCAICNSDGGGRSLHVDHCHSTGKLGQMLCTTCNVGLGSFKDDPALLAKAIKYLHKHRN